LLTEALDVGTDYPAVAFAIQGKLMEFNLVARNWEQALHHSSEMMKLQQSVGRRSGVPAIAYEAALIHLVLGDLDSARAMFGIVLKYQTLNKKDWGPFDNAAFDGVRKGGGVSGHDTKKLTMDDTAEWAPKIELWFRLFVTRQLGRGMDTESVDKTIEEMRELTDAAVGIRHRAAAYMLMGELFLQAERRTEAIEACDAGLGLEPKYNKAAKDLGCVPYMHYLKTRASFEQGNILAAKDSAKKLAAQSSRYPFHLLVSVRMAHIDRRLGTEFAEAYTELTVKPWSAGTLLCPVPADHSGEIAWDFTIASGSIDFVAYFQPTGSAGWNEVQRAGHVDSNDGPLEGSFTPESSGMLKLVFDNSKSWVRPKTVHYHIEPAGLTATSEPS